MKFASIAPVLFSLLSVAVSSPVERRDNPDAKTNYLYVVDEVLPTLYKNYNAVLDKFISSRKTPEDIDDLYQFSRTIFTQQVQISSAISYVEVEVFRGYASAPEANRTLFASAPKLEALVQPLQTAMDKVSSVEAAILAEGYPGHAAIFSSLVQQASTYNLAEPFPKKLTNGAENEISSKLVKLANIAAKVRDQYSRPNYCQTCYPY